MTTDNTNNTITMEAIEAAFAAKGVSTTPTTPQKVVEQAEKLATPATHKEVFGMNYDMSQTYGYFVATMLKPFIKQLWVSNEIPAKLAAMLLGNDRIQYVVEKIGAEFENKIPLLLAEKGYLSRDSLIGMISKKIERNYLLSIYKIVEKNHSLYEEAIANDKFHNEDGKELTVPAEYIAKNNTAIAVGHIAGVVYSYLMRSGVIVERMSRKKVDNEWTQSYRVEYTGELPEFSLELIDVIMGDYWFNEPQEFTTNRVHKRQHGWSPAYLTHKPEFLKAMERVYNTGFVIAREVSAEEIIAEAERLEAKAKAKGNVANFTWLKERAVLYAMWLNRQVGQTVYFKWSTDLAGRVYPENTHPIFSIYGGKLSKSLFKPLGCGVFSHSDETKKQLALAVVKNVDGDSLNYYDWTVSELMDLMEEDKYHSSEYYKELMAPGSGTDIRFDARNSGLQILAASFGCKKTMALANMFGEELRDFYIESGHGLNSLVASRELAQVSDNVSIKAIRDEMKKLVVPYLYGEGQRSVWEKLKEFKHFDWDSSNLEDKELRNEAFKAWDDTVASLAPAVALGRKHALEFFKELGEAGYLETSWYSPSGYRVHRQQVDYVKVSLPMPDGRECEFRVPLWSSDFKSTSGLANAVHSIDAAGRLKVIAGYHIHDSFSPEAMDVGTLFADYADFIIDDVYHKNPVLSIVEQVYKSINKSVTDAGFAAIANGDVVYPDKAFGHYFELKRETSGPRDLEIKPMNLLSE